MPYPTQITRESIIEQARELIEADGIDQLSLGRLATALHVKAPSLYRYFDGKTELLRAVNELTNRALIAQINQAVAAVPATGDANRAQSRGDGTGISSVRARLPGDLFALVRQ